MTTEDKKRKDRVLKDGEHITVPMHLMDSVQREVAKRAMITDALGRPAGFAPGYICAPPSAASRAKQAAYERRLGVLAASWCA